MNQRTIGLSQSALSDLIRRYEHRILTLEIELRQMVQEHTISVTQYKKRVLYLTQFRSQLNFLTTQIEASDRRLGKAAPSSRIPSGVSRSPEESQLCLNYFNQAGQFAKMLVEESQEVIRIVQGNLKGRQFSFLTLFDLSRLRKMILKVTQRENAYRVQQQHWQQYSANVLKVVSPILSSSEDGKSNVERLKTSYAQMEKINREVLSLNLECEKVEADLNLKENWLSFQEWKMSQYYPKRADGNFSRSDDMSE